MLSCQSQNLLKNQLIALTLGCNFQVLFLEDLILRVVTFTLRFTFFEHILNIIGHLFHSHFGMQNIVHHVNKFPRSVEIVPDTLSQILFVGFVQFWG